MTKWKVLQPRRVERITVLMHRFDYVGQPGAGYAFDVDEAGEQLPGGEDGRELRRANFKACLAGADLAGHQVIDLGVHDYSHDYRHEEVRECGVCGLPAYFSRCCGVFTCGREHHEGLVRCFCGWSMSGRDGARELVEMGEVL